MKKGEIPLKDGSGIELNPAQLDAVAHKKGPLLVVAGAGTGKTRVIVERIRRLIDSGIPPQTILALTFTEKAAGEMADRLAESGLANALGVTATTFNGFGNDILGQYGSEWGLGVLRLLGETGQLVFLREHLDDFQLDYFAPISNPDGQLSDMAKYVSLLKQQLIAPEAYIAYANDLTQEDEAQRLDKQKHTELARFYAVYAALCRRNQLIDYDDQLYLSVALLRARPNVLGELQSRFRYLLIDEFQDTNPMQAALVKLLAGKDQNVMVVGDDDQSIYGWRGATIANILDFKKQYPAAVESTLIENYRSSQSILDAAYRLIQHNNPTRLEVINKLNKRLHAQTNDGPSPIVRHFTTLEAELDWVSQDISRRLQAGQSPNSIAVLARRRQGIEKMHTALELHDTPHAVAGLSNDIYEQPTVRQLVEALKAVSDPLDNMALFHTLSGPIFNVPAGPLAAITSRAGREHDNLFAVIAASDEPELTKALPTITGWREQSRGQSVGGLAYAILNDSGWKEQLYNQAEHDVLAAIQVQALSTFFKTLKEFERISDTASVQSYLLNFPALRAGGSDFEDVTLDISDSLINVLSIHRAKGLEWDTVYIIDCTEGSFPLQKRGGSLTVPKALKAITTEADEHLAEERRLMYVAATRARSELIISYSDQHGSGAKRRPSRFLGELFEKTNEEVIYAEEQVSLELFSPKTATSTVIPLPKSMKRDGKLVLSVSDIVCWLDCPQEFYYSRVLGMPLPENPRQQYGTAIHGIIEQIHEGRHSGHVPTLVAMQTAIKAALPRAGYVSKGSRERAYEQATKSVERIYERFLHGPLPLESETPFTFEVPGINLKIKGRFDAIYALDAGIEIRDYKTSTSVTTPEKAKSRATSSKQLTLYALAWQTMHHEMPALLTLDFVEVDLLGSVKKQAKSLQTLVGKLETMVTQLQAGDYPPGKDHEYCHHP